MAITGLRCLALEPSPSLPRPVQGVNGVLSRDEGIVTRRQPPAPPAGAASPRPHGRGRCAPRHTRAPVHRPPSGPPAPAAAGLQGPDLWAESAQGGIHLKSHRKGNLGSKQSFCRWFLKHAKEADRSHSLNVSNSCEAGAGSGFTPDCCPRGPWGQGVSCQPLRSCLLPVQEQGWGCLGAEKDRG